MTELFVALHLPRFYFRAGFTNFEFTWLPRVTRDLNSVVFKFLFVAVIVAWPNAETPPRESGRSD